MQPLILLSAGSLQGKHSIQRTVSALYGEAIRRAGGIPAAAAGGSPEAQAERFDGLLLTGGGDVAPERYGRDRLPTDEVDERRDEEEFALLKAFADRGRPILGICRGIQVLNVYFGGTLIQQIPNHGNNTPHWLGIDPGSRLGKVFGPGTEGNSWHHQAIQTPAPALKVTARSFDGTIEGVEHASLPILGVQWHPERMIMGSCEDIPGADHLKLFIDFVKECEKHHESNQND